MTRHRTLAAALAASCLFPAFGEILAADEEKSIEVSIKDHLFDPELIQVPAGTAIKLTVKNFDPTPEEFESDRLGFEKVIAGNGSAVIRIKPLKSGSYDYFGEFHADTAQGKIVVE